MSDVSVSKPRFGGLRSYVALVHPTGLSMWATATVLFASIASRGEAEFGRVVQMAVVVAASQACVGSINEYCDRQYDAQFKPWRPIPSGMVSSRNALVMGLILGMVSLIAGATLGLLGLLGALVGTGVGLAHDVGMKRTILSWVPFIVGFTFHPLWVWAMVGQLTPDRVFLFVYAQPLIIGLHLANQLPDLEERKLGVGGLIYRLGPRWGPATTRVFLMIAPLGMAVPLAARPLNVHTTLFILGMAAYYAVVIPSSRNFGSKLTDYANMRRTFVAIGVSSLILLSSWLASVT